MEFLSKNVRAYEKEHGSILNLLKPSTDAVATLIEIAYGCDGDEACAKLDKLKKERGNIRGVLDYILDCLDEQGFLDDSTPATLLKELLNTQTAKAQEKVKSLM